MRVTRVSAPAFGPFTQQQLDFPPGLTIVWGLNEAGKSSWHSALYLALCGFRRARGRGLETDRDLSARHRPWAGGPWKVGANIELDDGERLTVGWDLKSKTAKVIDARGRDCSNRWITAGAVDLAQIVGLDRDSFLATACIRQSDILSVSDDPEKLQEFLQRAAATAGVDQTAAAALLTIERFRQDRVGTDRSNSTKPLVARKRAVVAAEAVLKDARSAHVDWLRLTESIQETSDRLALLGDRLAALRACLHFAQATQSLNDAKSAHEAISGLRIQLAALEHEQADGRAAIELYDARLAVLDRKDALDAAMSAHNAAASLVQRRDRLLEREIAVNDEIARLQAASQHALALSSAQKARAAHRFAVEAQNRLDSAIVERYQARANVLVAKEAHARVVALRRRQEADRVVSLSSMVPEAPEAPLRHEQLTQRVHTAVERWRAQPALAGLDGPTAAELRHQLETTPQMPDGETQPLASVVEAEARFNLAHGTLQAHLDRRPAMPPPLLVSASASAAQLEHLAIRLAAPSETPSVVEQQLERARPRSTPVRTAVSQLLFASLLTVAGVLLAVAGFIAGLAITVAGVVWLILSLRSRPVPDSVLREIVVLEQRLEDAHEAAGARAAAERDAIALGIAPTEQSAKDAARRLAENSRLSEQVSSWQQSADTLRGALEQEAGVLNRALDDAGATRTENLPERLERYRAACSERSLIARAAAIRPDLSARIRIRESEESDYENLLEQIGDLEAMLRRAASDAGHPATGETEAVAQALLQWLSEEPTRSHAAQTARDQWSELHTLLGGRKVDEVVDLADEAERCALRLGENIAQSGLTPAPPSDQTEDQLAKEAAALSTSVDTALASVARAETSVAERSLDPAEAENAENVLMGARAALDALAGNDSDDYVGLSADTAAIRADDLHTELVAVRGEAAEIAGQMQERELALGDLAVLHEELNVADHALQSVISRSSRPAAPAVAGLDRSTVQDTRTRHRTRLERAITNADTLRGALAEREALLPDLVSHEELQGQARDRMLTLLGADSGDRVGIDASSVPPSDYLDRAIATTDEEIIDLRELLALTRGQLEERSQHAVDPSAAAEVHAVAQSEYDKVRRLDHVLATTRLFLSDAQERVHRDIAPLIHAAADPRMPGVFGERYDHLLVDPQTLRVRVHTSSGEHREASLLSHGTTEQIYLILRLALVEVLTAASNESCPIILDDVTVNFDSERKHSVLTMLHAASTERQIIVFSQEEFVREWAGSTLTSEADRLVMLDGRAPV